MARTKQSKETIEKKTSSQKNNIGRPIDKSIVIQKKKKRFRPGTQCLREIKKLQEKTNLLIRKLPFQRLVREISAQSDKSFRYTTSALQALQEAVEGFTISLCEDAVLCSTHAKRVTLLRRDLQLTLRIKGLFTHE